VWVQQIQNALATRFLGKKVNLQVLSGRYRELPPSSVLRALKSPEKDLFGEDAIGERNRLLGDSLKSAREELGKLLGPDSEKWSWGTLHTVQFRHALDQLPGAKDLLNLGPLPRPGDEYTVNATGTGDSWPQVSGASYRQILDLATWDRSWVVNT